MNKLFPTILQQQQTEQGVRLLLDIEADLHYFQGHFPGAPVLAGVAQLDWAVQFSQQLLMGQRAVLAVEVLKFQHMVQPGCQISLELQQQKADSSTFCYWLDGNKVASGRLKWEQVV